MAPRYRQNPFGSKISRFNRDKKPIKPEDKETEEEKRIKALIKDLEEHTGVSQGTRPGLTTSKMTK